MNKYLLENFGITKLILIVITLTSVVSILVSGIMLNAVIKSYDEEMIKIISSDVYDNINNELLKTITISRTMASDSFLKQHLKNAPQIPQERTTNLLSEYLQTLKDNFGCSSAFLASDITKNYYTLNGFQKTLDVEKNPHDIWYKDFLEQDAEYLLNVDTDEANNFALTIFSNTRMEDSDGNFLGICGVGIGMDKVQKILLDAEEKHKIKISLVNKSGLVEVDTDSEKIENSYLENLKYQQSDEFILQRIKTPQEVFVVTKYIPNFDWYLVVQRNRADMQNAYSNLVLYFSIAWVISLALLLTFIQSSLNAGQKQIEDSATRHGIISHSGIYASMHLIDLKKNTIQELSSNSEEKIFPIQDGDHAREKINSVIKKITDKKSFPKMLEFMNFKNLAERMGDKQAIFQEFLSEDYGWCKAYFMLVDNSEDGAIHKIVFAIEIIEEEKRREKHLKHLSETDAMTGLRNRGSGEKTISNLMASGQSGMFVLLDADKFKSINDNFGHNVGDKVIIAIADCLKKAFRPNDITLRLGGDEFAAYAVGVTDKAYGKAIIFGLFSMIDLISIPELRDRKISISLGATIFHEQSEESFTEIYKQADSAAYISKKTQGNCMTFYESED